MKATIYTTILLSLLTLGACKNDQSEVDAYGNFEGKEVMVSALANGEITKFTANEGDKLKAGEIVGYIDTTAIFRKKQQLNSQIKIVHSKMAAFDAQIAVLKTKKENIIIEKNRVEKLIADNAAPTKQLDDINAQIKITNSNINSVIAQKNSVANELEIIGNQLDMANDQISNSLISNPIEGTVLETYIEETEVIAPGRPIYKIANLDEMILKVYVGATQLDDISVNQTIKVRIDDDKQSYHEYQGTITWISPKAEFTPKIIQTKEERTNLVYAIKIKVVNDGKIKIGMPGEALFNLPSEKSSL